jgi:uncharacterized protein YbjT (DUF2867 family)
MAGPGAILMAGATGLVGGMALPDLLARATGWQVPLFSVSRRPPKLAHGQLHALVGPLQDAEFLSRLQDQLDQAPTPPLGVFVSAIGTTLKAAGSAPRFAAIDRDLVVALARIARSADARQAVIVSSVGADADSPNLYLRVKGEMESAVAGLGFERVDFLHPGLLLGPRGGERRTGEHIAQRLAPLYNPLLMGRLRRYRAIDAAVVAGALAALVGRPGRGRSIHRYDALQELARED